VHPDLFSCFCTFLSRRVEIFERFESATLESMLTCSKYSNLFYVHLSFCDVPGQMLEVCRFDPAMNCFLCEVLRFWLVLVGFGWGFSAFEARCDSNSDGHWPWGQIFVRDSMLFLSSASQIQSLLCIQLLFCKESPGKARLYSCMLLLILLFWFVVFVNSDAKHGPRAG
jgi:hypothetical protein